MDHEDGNCGACIVRRLCGIISAKDAEKKVRYIYQHKDWPKFRWSSAELAAELEGASFSIGKFSGRLAAIGFEMQSDAVCETLSAEILNSAEIEGERLNRDDVRSSVAKRMEIVLSGAKSATSREAEARADMMIDATRNWEVPMTVERLFSWHAALFPTGYSGLSKIAVGRFRDDSEGPMRVVSRHGMMERVHFVAPDAQLLDGEIKRLLGFVNGDDAGTPWLVRAALAHLWFLTLHPFDDGNGRLAHVRRCASIRYLRRYRRRRTPTTTKSNAPSAGRLT